MLDTTRACLQEPVVTREAPTSADGYAAQAENDQNRPSKLVMPVTCQKGAETTNIGRQPDDEETRSHQESSSRPQRVKRLCKQRAAARLLVLMADGDPGGGSAPIRSRLGRGRQLGDEEAQQYSSEVPQLGRKPADIGGRQWTDNKR